MRFWRSTTGGLLLLGLAGLVLLLAGLTVQVYRVISPMRIVASGMDLDPALVDADEVSFASTDGLRLRAWMMHGREGMPPVILAHDLGANRASLVGLGLSLHEAGFTVLLLDFRGHGESEGGSSSLGLKEKRDILGAVEFLADPTLGARQRIGVFGTGMGAQAAVLAAADRPVLRVLVLDDLDPDASYPLVNRAFAGWSFGAERLRGLTSAIFAMIHGTRIGRHRAVDVLGRLPGRDVLLLAAEGDVARARDTKRLYERIPAQRDVDGNLIFVPATLGQGLYGEALRDYYDRVTRFFVSRLPRS